MDYKDIKVRALERITQAFDLDELTFAFAKGETTPKRGQLEAIKLAYDRANNLTKAHLGFVPEKVEQSGELHLVIESNKEGVYLETPSEPMDNLKATNAV